MNIKWFITLILLIASIIANPVYAQEFPGRGVDDRASGVLTQHPNFIPTPTVSNLSLPRQDASPELATVYYVDAINGSNVTGDGTASAPWQTITYALSQVTGPNVEIHVALGVYNQALGESFPITMEPGVSLVGADYATTIIEGSGSGSLVYFPSTATYTETTVLSGFKIMNGSEGVRVEGYATTSGSSPTIQGNWITGNTYGIYNVTASSRRAYPVIKGNHISNNTSYGIYNSAGYTRAYANPVIEENQIVGNGSGGIFCYAAASYNATSYCSPLIKGNFISGNGGNGVTCHTYYAGSCSPQLIGNTVANNNGWGVGRAHEGTPLVSSNPVFVNNLFYGNSSGGAIFKTGLDTPTFVNNTIVYNNSYGIWNGAPLIVNSIIWGHNDDLNVAVDRVSYSDIGDGEYGGANHNISVSPQFADPAQNDYHVLPTSPVIDMGDSAYSSLPATDIDSDPRILGAAVDIGADETISYSVSMSKSVWPTGTVYLGDMLTYTLALTKSSTSAGGVLITDTLPAGTTWGGYVQSSVGYATVNSGTLTWLGTLLATNTQTITYNVTVNPGLSVGTLVTNTAVVDNRTGGITTTQPVTVVIGPTVLWNSSYQVVDSPYTQPGQRVAYTITVINTGNHPAANVIVTDTLDSHVTFASASASGMFSNGMITWSDLTITDSAVITMSLAVTVNTPLTDATPIINQVKVAEGGGKPFDLPTGTAVIWVYNLPQADFDATPQLGPVPLSVTFHNYSQHGTHYLWSYGDSVTSTISVTHPHTFANAGVYTVTLQASNPVGADIFTRTNYITIYHSAVASFVGSPRVGLWPLEVVFTNTSLYANQFVWEYGDGFTSTITATRHAHTFTSPGTYTVTLTATGLYNHHTLTRTAYVAVYNYPVASFSGTPVNGIAPLVVSFNNYSLNATSYRWDFGDGSISYLKTPVHQYLHNGVFTVTLTASNPGGSDTLIRPMYITVHDLPSANFYAKPTVGLAPLTITLTNTSQLATSYLWNYGDGTTSTVTTTAHSHQYVATGIFSISLTAFNPYGSKTYTRTAYIAAYDYPIASFTAIPVTGVAPLRVSFANLSEHASSYLWRFGDGGSSTAISPTHQYTTGGVYTVSLRASNPAASNWMTRTQYITVYDPPLPDFIGKPRIGVAPLTVTFTNTSQLADTFMWVYGDGVTSTTTATVHNHIYTLPGMYTVTLFATNIYSQTNTARPSYVAVYPQTSETVYYVDAVNGIDAPGNGSQAAPWRTITFALSQVIGPDVEIRVASGVYNQALGESFPITMEPGVSLVGADYVTTIIEGSGSGSLVYFPSTATYTETTVLSGFKIMNGSEGVRVEGYATTSGSSPTIQGNWITGNTYGIYNVTASSRRAYPVIKGNHISNNTSYGIYNSAGYTRAYANPVIEENQIVGNGSGGIFCYAAASSGATSYCSPIIKGNLISSNDGNGVTCHTYYAGSCSPQLVGNTVANNNGWGVGRAHEGTPLVSSNPVFVNNLFYGNSSGGAIFKTGLDTPTFVNNTIVYNNSYGIWNGTPLIVNSIIWGHNDDLNAAIDRVSYSDIGDAEYGGINYNISLDPQFVDSTYGNYHLSPTSPAIDAGDSTNPNLPATDIDGDPRILLTAVDIGADEVVLAAFAATQQVSPSPIHTGQQLTYTLRITNTGFLDLHATITDILPAHVAPAGMLTWTATITTPGGVWTRQVVVTAELGYVGPLTNVVQITTDEWARGIYTNTLLVIDMPIVGLHAANDGPTLLGYSTTLSATVTSGTHVAYAWAWGDGEIGYGAVLTHTYLAAGAYTAVVTASNSASVLTATTIVTVNPTGAGDVPISGLDAMNNSPTALGHATTFTATVSAGTHITYTWLFGDGTVGCGPVVTHTYPSVGEYTAIVIASNSANALITNTTVTVYPENQPQHHIYLPIVLRTDHLANSTGHSRWAIMRWEKFKTTLLRSAD